MPHLERMAYEFKYTDENGRKYRENRIKDKDGNPKRFYWDAGVKCDDVWSFVREPDLNSLTGSNKERTGYPTQKPVALYDRIIRAASNEGDIVLDPFCGCATTLIAAERLGRRWIGMDLWDKAGEVVKDRIEAEGIVLPLPVNFTIEPPTRTDDGKTASPVLRAKNKFRLTPPAPRMSRDAMKAALIEEMGGRLQCQGCGRVFDHPSFLELDHQVPRSEGGQQRHQ